jgi:hypothetical protein
MPEIIRKIWVVLIALTFVMTACKPGTAAETQANPQAVYTNAAGTANAKMTEIMAVTPTQVTSTITGTPTATATAGPSDTPTQSGPTATLTLPALVGNLLDRAEFVSDISVPDFTTFVPNQSFTKTWRLKNTGTSTWTTAYSLVFYSGAQMGGASSTPLYREVRPGDTVDLSIDMVSPAGYGQYTGYWILRNPLDKNFGVGVNADQAFYVIINVAASGTAFATATLTPTITQPATLTPTLGNATSTGTTSAPAPAGDVVSGVTLSAIGNTDYNGSCSSYFMTFMTTFALTQAAQVSYNVNVTAGSDFQYTLQPGNQSNVSMTAGNNNRGFELHFTSSGSGQITVQATTPNGVTSNSVAFSVTCQ